MTGKKGKEGGGKERYREREEREGKEQRL